MTICLDKAIISNYRTPSIFCPSVNCYTFADGGIITNFSGGLFTGKFEILRDATYYSPRENTTIFPDTRAIHDNNIRAYPCSFAYFYVFMNSYKRFDHYIFRDFGLRMYICQ